MNRVPHPDEQRDVGTLVVLNGEVVQVVAHVQQQMVEPPIHAVDQLALERLDHPPCAANVAHASLHETPLQVRRALLQKSAVPYTNDTVIRQDPTQERHPRGQQAGQLGLDDDGRISTIAGVVVGRVLLCRVDVRVGVLAVHGAL